MIDLAGEEDTNSADSNNGIRAKRVGEKEEASAYKEEADKSRDRLREMERFIANLKASK